MGMNLINTPINRMDSTMKKWISTSLLLVLLMSAVSLQPARSAEGGVVRTTFSHEGHTLVIELLDDDLAHFELTAAPTDGPIWTTPMVSKTDYPGPSQVNSPSDTVLETPDMRLDIDPTALCVTITDLTRDPDLVLTTVCPIGEDWDGLTITPEGTTDLYGLGEYFPPTGGLNGNLNGARRTVGNRFGNEMAGFSGGNVGNAQFPILYALGAGTDNYALFLDNIYKQAWNLKADPFTVTTTDTVQRWYIMTGPDLADLRRDYMELTGRPPGPPQKFFGLWVSEYGYDNWDELLGVLDSMRGANFPMDGFVLDLQWFGGIQQNASQMGSLAWDEANFPNPATMIADLRGKFGLGITTIEEPYVSTTARGYAEAELADVLVGQCPETDCDIASMTQWWGQGGMVDWTDPEAAAWWHDNRRQHLIDAGVIGHWTDLGEPENYSYQSWYYGFPELDRHQHMDIHNVYNLSWSASIWDGYARNNPDQRPFILSRSGTSGIQRYGVAMWSGDIGSNVLSLQAHLNAQMDMSLSGIDYFGSDVGGFFRNAFEKTMDKPTLYTVWFANAALLDVPLRPHTMNVDNIFDTAPSLIGDVASNLANVRLRYALSPYLYTLAHRAYRNADPVFGPLVYYFQDDPTVRALAGQKMIGPDMMMAVNLDYAGDSMAVYLPAGGWFNYYTHEYIQSAGDWVVVPTKRDGLFQVPLFVRAGAIIPEMFVDAATLNLLGQRTDGTTRDDLILNVYGDAAALTLIEDDGTTLAYQNGAVRETPITYGVCEAGWCLEIGAAVGTFDGAANARPVEVRFIAPPAEMTTISLNDTPLPRISAPGNLAAATRGWTVTEGGVVVVKLGVMEVGTAVQVVLK